MVAVPVDMSISPETQENEEEDASLYGDTIGMISLKVRDLADINNVITLTCPALTTFEEFLHDIGERTHLSPEEFDIAFQNRAGIHDLRAQDPQATFESLQIIPDGERVYQLTLERKRSKKKPVVRRLDADFDAVAYIPRNPMVEELQQEFELDESSVPKQEVTIDRNSLLADDSENVCNFKGFTGREFVGLKNQSTTCYLNSLVQGLFFTPEFRNMIYNSKFEHDSKVKSIGLALQRVFLLLQFSVRSSVETSEITRTFGWKNDENSIQHDVEECFRTIIELLSEEFKKSSSSSAAEALFGGIMNDYVECLTCHNRNSKRELFVVVPLPVRMYGKALSQPTLEAALRTFVQAELLNENNQYKCENCGCLVDAHKGLCFQKLPYLMCIQLKRSEFDFELMTRRKISDKVMFPTILNMNEFVRTNPGEEVADDFIPHMEESIVKAPVLQPRTKHSRPTVRLPKSEADKAWVNGDAVSGEDLARYGLSAGQYIEVVDALKGGDNVYQLLSVMVHKGNSSLAGHYYVYVFDLEKRHWYRCNDSSVTKASEADLTETFGSNNPFNRNEERDAIAYMLVYRKVDFTLNSLPLLEDQLPIHIKELWEDLRLVDEDSHYKEEFERSVFRFPVYYRYPRGWDTIKKEMVIPKTFTMKEAAQQCYLTFFPEPEMENPIIRLVRYNEYEGVMDLSFDGKEDDEIGVTYRRPSNIEQNDALMLEHIMDVDWFDHYEQKDFVFKTHFVDLKSDDFVGIFEIHGKLGFKVENIRARVARYLALQTNIVHMIVKNKGGTRFLDDDSQTLTSLNLARISELFVAVAESADVGAFCALVSNYYSSYHFEIQCQLLAPSFDPFVNPDDMDMDVLCSPSVYGDASEELEMLVGLDNQSANEELTNQGSLNYDSPEQQDLLSEEVIQFTKYVSDNGSEDSSYSTSSETTMVGCESRPGSSSSDTKNVPCERTNGYLNSDVDAEVPMFPEEHVPMKVGPAYFKSFNHQRSKDGEWLSFDVRAIKDMPIEELSRRISRIISVEESQFIMYAVTNGIELEISYKMGALKDLAEFDLIKTRIGHRLMKNEARVPVYFLDLAAFKKNAPFLSELILQDDMTVEDVRQKIKTELSAHCDFDQTHLQQFRLRKKVNNTPSRIMHDDTKLIDYLFKMKGELFFQPLSGPDECIEQGHTIIARHWHPSELVLDPPKEFVVFYDYIVSLEELLHEKLVNLYSIPSENLEVACPEVEYPYDLNPIDIEKLMWHPLDSTKRRHISIHNDEGVLFVRDKTESLKYISPEERKAFEKEGLKRRGEYILTPRKIESGFHVNLSRTPPNSS